jgi:hypothetical protein
VAEQPRSPSPPPPEAAVRLLEPLIGKMTARKAVELACRSGEDLTSVVEGLRPMLRTLLGSATAEHVLAQLAAPRGGKEEL